LMARTSQPRSLLSIARLNIAKSRVLPWTCSLIRIDQTCFGRRGGFAPVSFPLFQGIRLSAGSSEIRIVLRGRTPWLQRRMSFASQAGRP
jgi:hypothetical protein